MAGIYKVVKAGALLQYRAPADKDVCLLLQSTEDVRVQEEAGKNGKHAAFLGSKSLKVAAGRESGAPYARIFIDPEHVDQFPKAADEDLGEFIECDEDDELEPPATS